MSEEAVHNLLDITDDDYPLLVAEIQRFCQRNVRPLCGRGDEALSTEKIQRLERQAAEIGLLNFGPESALGLWEAYETARGRMLSVSALRYLAAVDAGLAFHFHQLALGGLLSRELELGCQVPTVVCLQGTFGLARHSLARLLLGKPLTADDRAMLADYFVTHTSQKRGRGSLPDRNANVLLLVQVADAWQRLLVPCLDEQDRLVWSVLHRDDLELEELPHSHGLDGTQTWQWRPNGGLSEHVPLAGEAALQWYQRLLHLNALALLAIALGAVQNGHALATEYAGVRRQGGRPINQHPAVQQMLARCQSTIWTVEHLLDGLAAHEVSAVGLGRSFAARAVAHPLLCQAANDVLQVFGGLGYICETGVERIVRDVNHLRLLAGTPDEILLFLSEWDCAS